MFNDQNDASQYLICLEICQLNKSNDLYISQFVIHKLSANNNMDLLKPTEIDLQSHNGCNSYFNKLNVFKKLRVTVFEAKLQYIQIREQ